MFVDQVLRSEISQSVEVYCRKGFNERRFQNLRDMVLSLGVDDCGTFEATLDAFVDDLTKKGLCFGERQKAVEELRKDLSDRKNELASLGSVIDPHLAVSRLKEGRT